MFLEGVFKIESDIIHEIFLNNSNKKITDFNNVVKNRKISKFLEDNYIFLNNFSSDELEFSILYLKSMDLSIDSIFTRQTIIIELIKLLKNTCYNINNLSINLSFLENIRNLNINNLDNDRILSILNDFISFFYKIKILISFISKNQMLKEIFNAEIDYFNSIFECKFSDDIFNEGIKFINNNEKIVNSICFNKNSKLKYIISFNNNFDIISKCVYNYLKILLFLKISDNIITNNKKYTFSIIKKNVKHDYIKKMSTYLNRFKDIDVFVIFNNYGSREVNVKQFFKNNKNIKYSAIYAFKNNILCRFLGLTFNYI